MSETTTGEATATADATTETTETTALATEKTHEAEDQNQTAPNGDVTKPALATKVSDGEQQEPSEDGETATEAEAAEPPGAPEKYELKPPEGLQLDDRVREEFEVAARELNLTNDGAQAIIDKVVPAIEQRRVEQMAAMQTEWRETLSKDPEFAGEGRNEKLAQAVKFLDPKYGLATDGLRELLNGPIGDHPELIRFLYRLGGSISEDSIVRGGAAKVARDIKDPRVQAKILFGSET